MPTSRRIFLAILILGAYSQIVQALLIREGLVVFYGNEVSLGAFFGSWLFWLALGSLLVVRWRERPMVQDPLPWISRLLLLLPLVLILQVLMLRTVRLLLDVSASEFVPLGELFLSLFLIVAPGSLLLGFAFPLACKALRDYAGDGGNQETVRDISRLYIADALGALLGGVLFTFVFIQWLGITATLGVTTLLLAVTALKLKRSSAGSRWPAILLAVLGLIITLPVVSPWLDRQMETLRFSTLQPGLELFDATETRYGHLAIAGFGGQTTLVNNGQVAESFPLPLEIRQQAAYLMSQAAGAKRVLLFGGFASGLAVELLHYPVTQIDVVEEDEQAFRKVMPYLPEQSRKALADPRLQIHFMDGRRYLNSLPVAEHYNLVLVLNATPSSAYSNRYFTSEFYQGVRHQLASDGVFCTRVSGASNYLGRTVRSFSGSVFRTLREVLPNVAVAPGDNYLFCASTAAGRVTESASELELRYLDIPLEDHRFPAKVFYTILPDDEVRFVRDQLEQPGSERNSDARPVTYYLNMLLWGQFSASGFADWMEQLRGVGIWAYLLPMLLFLLLWLLRTSLEGGQRSSRLRKASTLILFVLGLVAMAAQLAVLFSYQSHIGFMFERVALLNGLFMTGLALGAGAGSLLARTDRPALRLGIVLILVTIFLAALPHLLNWLGQLAIGWQEWGYLLISLLLGLLAGTGFPLAVKITELEQAAVVRSSGITQAADNLGGAVGGLLTGALMVPLLGIEWSSYLLAIFTLLMLLPLLFTAIAPQRMTPLQLRGRHAFPWPNLGWRLVFLVLLSLAWAQYQQAIKPAPQLHFSDQLLATVSESSVFELKEMPFIHYLGSVPKGTADIFALATMAVAPEVLGFAGPINLLLSVDAKGRLREVRYIDSNETPSYISGIDGWLTGLAGMDLSVGPLSLSRVDALTGATISSEAALASINQAARVAGQTAFGKSFAQAASQEEAQPAWYSPEFMVTVGLLLLFFPVYLSGSENGRLIYQFAALMILGFWLNSQVTEVDLVNLGFGLFSSIADNPQHWLLIGFALVTTLLFGPVWCGYLCPFGALQEFVSRIGHRLGLRSYASRPLDSRLRFLKYLLLGLLLIVVWGSGDSSWALFDPMQYVFGEHWPEWMLGILLLVLLGALFHYRFWCRYLCPLGAFLAFGNKFALLQRLAPERRFNHCDLGVRETFDIDCIRCNRCLTGRDTHLKLRGFGKER
ncbi:4Fe-4S binding protein [endosymbiont of Lamellibrachia barhami]|uniref:spermine/spermidine synthase domain-containing protein n=1 Tax=endosymbiont of Lamellibrachia barhami TaxID=205975 RepID=UPI0015AD6AD8|nr:4Fe-4S binding protein [endosymbiont of Lamellibrachia barhami]